MDLNNCLSLTPADPEMWLSDIGNQLNRYCKDYSTGTVLFVPMVINLLSCGIQSRTDQACSQIWSPEQGQMRNRSGESIDAAKGWKGLWDRGINYQWASSQSTEGQLHKDFFLPFSKTLTPRHLLLWTEHTVLHNQPEMFKSPLRFPLKAVFWESRRLCVILYGV